MRAALLLLVPSVAWACPKLEPIGKLYDAYAAEPQTTVELDLPLIAGPPVKLADADLVVVGPLGAQVYAPDGSSEHVDDAWTKRAAHLVVAPERKASYADIRKALLAARALGYADIAIGYRAFGVMHGRAPVETPEATRKQVNIPAWGVAFHKELVAHCPDVAEVFERDPMAASTVAAAAPLVRGCACEVDARYLEQWPALVGEQLLTTVPLAARAPAPPPTARWGDLVKGKPVPLALPDEPPHR